MAQMGFISIGVIYDITTRHKRNFGGGSLMVWAAFGNAGKSRICFIQTKTNSEIYTQLLEEELIDFATELYADNWTF